MTKRQIMARAHELARTMKGDYSACLVLGLRQAWWEARLIRAGGRLWEKAGHRRIYINNLVQLYGLELDHYNTGNICKAQIDGERISNNSARRLVSMLSYGNLWYDLNAQAFGSKDLSAEAVQRITQRLAEVA